MRRLRLGRLAPRSYTLDGRGVKVLDWQRATGAPPLVGSESVAILIRRRIVTLNGQGLE